MSTIFSVNYKDDEGYFMIVAEVSPGNVALLGPTSVRMR